MSYSFSSSLPLLILFNKLREKKKSIKYVFEESLKKKKKKKKNFFFFFNFFFNFFFFFLIFFTSWLFSFLINFDDFTLLLMKSLKFKNITKSHLNIRLRVPLLF